MENKHSTQGEAQVNQAQVPSSSTVTKEVKEDEGKSMEAETVVNEKKADSGGGKAMETEEMSSEKKENNEGTKADEKKVVEKSQKSHPVLNKLLGAFNVAQLEFLNGTIKALESYKPEDGVFPDGYAMSRCIKWMYRAPEGEAVSLARKALHLINDLKGKHDRSLMYKSTRDMSQIKGSVVWDGLLAVNKPKGYTSADVVALVRSTIEKNMRFNNKRGSSAPRAKVGHGGTLDPLANGILVIGIGSGCKKMKDFLHGKKSYIAEAKLGEKTDTYDREGKVIEKKDASHVTDEKLDKCLESFKGDIKQVPPMYSALKKNGKRLCDLAREGITVQRDPRDVTVYEIKRVNREEKKLPTCCISMDVSKGFYVRSLVNDVGEKLGTVAHMTELTRCQQGPFKLEDCLDIAKVSDAASIAEYLQRARKKFPNMPEPADARKYMLQPEIQSADDIDIKRRSIEDIKIGEKIKGVVMGSARIGFFVDIGLSRDALLRAEDCGALRLRKNSKVEVVVTSVDVRSLKVTVHTEGGKPAGRDASSRENNSMKTVCLAGLPEDVTEEKIKEKMKDYGTIKDILLGGQEKKLPQGVAYVHYETKEGAGKAIESPPKFNDEAGSVLEIRLLSEHLKERAKVLLLVLKGDSFKLPRSSVKEIAEKIGGQVQFVEYMKVEKEVDGKEQPFKIYIQFKKRSSALKAKSSKEDTVVIEERKFQILKTTDEDVKNFNDIRMRQMQRPGRNNNKRGVWHGKRKRFGGGGGRYNNRRKRSFRR